MYISISDGCPNGCNSHGLCQLFADGWRCNCREGWKGPACNVAMEMECENDADDDKGQFQMIIIIRTTTVQNVYMAFSIICMKQYLKVFMKHFIT